MSEILKMTPKGFLQVSVLKLGLEAWFQQFRGNSGFLRNASWGGLGGAGIAFTLVVSWDSL